MINYYHSSTIREKEIIIIIIICYNLIKGLKRELEEQKAYMHK